MIINVKMVNVHAMKDLPWKIVAPVGGVDNKLLLIWEA